MKDFLTGWKFLTTVGLGVSIPLSIYSVSTVWLNATEAWWLLTGTVFFVPLLYTAYILEEEPVLEGANDNE